MKKEQTFINISRVTARNPKLCPEEEKIKNSATANI